MFLREKILQKNDVAAMNVVDAVGFADEIARRAKTLEFFRENETFDLGFHLVRKLVAIGRENLDAVVVIRIMRSRDHDPRIRAHALRDERHARRGKRADQNAVSAHRADSRSDRLLDHVARKARVFADDDPRAADALDWIPRGLSPSGIEDFACGCG